MKYTTEGILDVTSVEDGGQALICDPFPIETLDSDEENGMSVKIQSWDEDMAHSDFNLIRGKKVRITIEVIE